jgi:hypothetical protein
MKKKRGRKPFKYKNDEIDIAILDLGGGDVPAGPVVLVPETYAPIVGEQVGLCGDAHGTTLLTRGGEVYRFGPVVQTGIIAAKRLSRVSLGQPRSPRGAR